MSTSTQRMRRLAERRTAGLAVYPLVLPEADVLDTLERHRLLTRGETDNPQAVAAALARLVRIVCRLPVTD